MNTPELLRGLGGYIHSIFTDITSAITAKAIPALLVSVFSYLIGVKELPLFEALIVLVLIEFIIRILAEANLAFKKKNWRSIVQAVEIICFGVAVQMVVYGLLTSAAHLTDSIVVGAGSFIEGTVISFLALSQLVRILKIASGMGYSMPGFFVDWIKSYTDAGTIKEATLVE